MATINVSDATGVVLDWLVAKCEGKLITLFCGVMVRNGPALSTTAADPLVKFSPSTDWSQGGPIIDRERISLKTQAHPGLPWVAFIDFGGSSIHGVRCRSSGPTPLIAAMRCYVASKLGDTVEVPDELLAA